MFKKIFIQKRLKLYLILCLIFLFSFFTFGCNKSSDIESQQSKFDQFIHKVFVNEVQSNALSLHYTLSRPEEFGIEPSEVTLGEYSIIRLKEELMTSEEYLKELKEFDYNSLTLDQQLTYDILHNYLETELELGNYLYYFESLGPTTGLQAQLPILLAEYNFYDKDDIERYLDLLPCVYDYFEDISEFEKEKSEKGLFMSNAVADRIIQQCEAFIANPDENLLIEYFDEKIKSFQNLTDEERKTYKNENKKRVLEYIIPSYELIIDVLQELKGSGKNNAGLYYYPKGKAYYKALAKIKSGSSRSLNDIIKMLETNINDDIMEITNLAILEPSLLNTVESFTAFPLTDPETILEDLKKNIVDDFPEPVDVNCEIKYVSKSLSDYLSPAMYLVPAIDNYTDNNIYINGNDLETLSTIYPTVAHEGYPGHLYQNVYFRSLNPAPIRNLLNFVGYDEGWATYVEYLSYSYAGIDPKLASLLEINNRVLLMIHARADIGIHYEGWTKDKAVTYISQYTGDMDVAEAIYNRLLEEPAIYLPYAIGYLEIIELKNIAQEKLGDDFNLKEFHKFLLDIGPAQFGIIEDHIEVWLSNKEIASK